MHKLLQINVTSNWGSTGKIAESIGNAVLRNGWDSYIAYGRMNNLSKSHMIQIGSKVNTYTHFVYDRLLDKEGLGSKIATKKLVEHIKRLKPDVVQLHNIHDHFLNYQILFEYLNKTDIKIFWTFHDCWAFTGHCYHFVEFGCMKWQSECCNCPDRYFFIDRSRKNFLLKKQLFSPNKNLTIVSCSNWMKNVVKQSFLKNKRVQVIHNGIDLSIFKPQFGLKKSDGKFHIIAVSNVWQAYKGMYDIFKIRELLADDFEITMVGLSAEQINKLPDGIRGIQKTQNIQQLVELYNKADVLINPTYADTFPTVNLEALACGTPVISYLTCGSPEAIDEKTGVVVEQGSVIGLINAILDMRVNPLSPEDCRMRAVKYFNKDKCFDEYIHLYEEALYRK